MFDAQWKYKSKPAKKGKEQWVGNNRVKMLKANPENYYLFR
jgi:hypothetical protein